MRSAQNYQAGLQPQYSRRVSVLYEVRRCVQSKQATKHHPRPPRDPTSNGIVQRVMSNSSRRWVNRKDAGDLVLEGEGACSGE